MLNFYNSCFDPDTDGTAASISSFTLAVKTGDLHEDAQVSKFFIEGALLFVTNQCEAFGFVAGSNESKFAAVWRVPNTAGSYWGELDFKTGRFRTNAKNNFARQGFGMLGMGAAFAARSVGFRSAWSHFLTELDQNDVAAVNRENLCWLGVEAAKGLEVMAPDRDTNRWLLDVEPSDTPPRIEDLRHHFTKVEDFLAVSDTFDTAPEFETRFQGPQLRIVRDLLRRRKHTVLLGPPGVGKTVSAFEALTLEGFVQAGKDYQLFTGHDEVKSADFLGGWQPSGDPQKPYVWVNGCLVRAMTANGGDGQPILVEEFTRMPTRAQNMFISALSDGYVVLNEKPDANGDGEIIKAGSKFVLLADMNVDPSADDIELYGAAFSSRVRKVEYEYPSVAGLLSIVAQDVPETTTQMRGGIAGVYDVLRKKWEAAELTQPISPRACVQWAEEIVASLDSRSRSDSSAVRSAAIAAAQITWLRDIAGTDAKLRRAVMADVEAQFRKAFQGSRQAKAA
jgi:MoxR-like ATPase